MKYKIVTSNSIKEVSLGKISSNLEIQSEIYALSDREIYLGMISHKTLVFFATEFADYALQNYAKGKHPKTKTCIALTRKWIKDDASVSKEELMPLLPLLLLLLLLLMLLLILPMLLLILPMLLLMLLGKIEKKNLLDKVILSSTS
jgi:hypothetical protein